MPRKEEEGSPNTSFSLLDQELSTEEHIYFETPEWLKGDTMETGGHEVSVLAPQKLYQQTHRQWIQSNPRLRLRRWSLLS